MWTLSQVAERGTEAGAHHLPTEDIMTALDLVKRREEAEIGLRPCE